MELIIKAKLRIFFLILLIIILSIKQLLLQWFLLFLKFASSSLFSECDYFAGDFIAYWLEMQHFVHFYCVFPVEL